MIHRDLKPSNLFLQRIGQEERLIVIDFGISKGEPMSTEKVTKTGQVFGTPHYMSPEQIQRPHLVGPSSDLYSLGVIMYELLSGSPPFQEDNMFNLFTSHMTKIPPKLNSIHPEISFELSELVDLLLRKTVDERPLSAESVAERLVEIRSKPLRTAINSTGVKQDNGLSRDR